jgi:hypothetical protein
LLRQVGYQIAVQLDHERLSATCAFCVNCD